MRRFLYLGLMSSFSLLSVATSLRAQSCPALYAQITAAGLGADTPLATGTLTIIATDASHNPINYSVSGLGVVLTKPKHAVVVNGALTSLLCLPRSDKSSVAVGYHFILRDTSAQGGNAVVMDVQDVAITTSVFSLDALPFTPQTSPYTLTSYVPPAATVALGTVTVLAAGSSPTVAITGPPQAAVLNFGLATGAPGVSAAFRGAWSSTSTYAIGDAVAYTDGSSYVSLTASNTNHTPNTDPTDWAVLAAHGATGPSGSAMTITTVTSSTTGTAQSYNQLIRCGATLTYTLPPSPQPGEIFVFKNIGKGNCTLASAAFIDGQSTQVLPYVVGFQQSINVAYDNTSNTWNIF